MNWSGTITGTSNDYNLANTFHKIDLSNHPIEVQAWIDSFCDTDNTSTFTLSSSSLNLNNIDDGISLVYLQSIGWD